MFTHTLNLMQTGYGLWSLLNLFCLTMIVLSPEFLFKFTKYSVSFLCFWPPYKDSLRNEIIKFNIKWWIMFVISLSTFTILLNSFFQKQSAETVTILYLISAICSSGQIVFKMIIGKLCCKKFQFLLQEMENYIRTANNEERFIFVRYANYYGFIHIVYIVVIYFAAISTMFGPIFLPQSLPGDVEYPFEYHEHPVIDFLYGLQIVQLLQCSAAIVADCQMAALLWYLVARFEILGIDVKSVNNAYEFGCWIGKHQKLFRHTEEVLNVCKHFQLIVIILVTLPIIVCGIIIQLKAPLILKIQVFSYVLSFTAQLFISAWPSEFLMKMCENIAWDVYNSDYSKNNFDHREVFVIQRTQSPPTISIPGVFPALSLKYYSQFLSRTFSYFTTARLIIQKMDQSNQSTTH